MGHSGSSAQRQRSRLEEEISSRNPHVHVQVMCVPITYPVFWLISTSILVTVNQIHMKVRPSMIVP